MALNQMYATTGRKLSPDYTAIINSQTPYLLGMKRQEKMDELTQRDLALREQQMLQNEELARQEMEENQKQTRKANLLGLANLGLKGGLAAYENLPEVKGVVDKAVGGVKDFISGPVQGTTPTYDMLSKAGDWPEYASGKSDLFSNIGTLTGEVLKPTAESAWEYADSFLGSGGDVYGSAIESALDFSDFDWGAWDLF